MALRLGTKAPAALPAAAPSALALPKKVKLNPIAQATLQALDGPRPQAKTDLPFDPQPEGNVWTAFPLHDLGLIRTTGRHGQAFRLDSGSLRGMALMVRRVVDEGRQGFEISFEARGAAGETYRRRLVDRGAKTTTCSFRVATPDESTDGRSRLVEGSGTATVSGEALVLEHPGRWRVSFVAHKPEALRGSMRLRVFGDDKAATEALSDAIIRLGLQSAFAPPAQQATDRLSCSAPCGPPIQRSSLGTAAWRTSPRRSSRRVIERASRLRRARPSAPKSWASSSWRSRSAPARSSISSMRSGAALRRERASLRTCSRS